MLPCPVCPALPCIVSTLPCVTVSHGAVTWHLLQGLHVLHQFVPLSLLQGLHALHGAVTLHLLQNMHVLYSAVALHLLQSLHVLHSAVTLHLLLQGLHELVIMSASCDFTGFDCRGALTLASPEVKFEIDTETHDPLDVGMYQVREANQMVEEMMLLANITVAEHILRHFPAQALLRRHPVPPPRQFDPLLKAAVAAGVSINPETSQVYLCSACLNLPAVMQHHDTKVA